jgi:hypothetical protein
VKDLGQITAAEFDAIQARKQEWATRHTAAQPRPVMRWDAMTYGPWTSADTPEQCTEATFDPKFKQRSPREWLKGFLDFYGFKPPPLHDPANRSVRFNQRYATVEEVADLAHEHYLYSIDVERRWVDTFKPDGTLFLDTPEIDSTVRQTYQDRRGDAESGSVTVQVVWPFTFHGNLANAGTTTDPWQMLQGQVAVVLQMHHDDEPGVEYQAFAQLQFGKYANDDDRNARLQQVMLGGQVAWVIPLFERAAQIAFFAQALGGGANLYSKAKGPGAQVAYGVQFTIGSGKAQFVLALQAGATASFPSDGTPSLTADYGTQMGLVTKVIEW